MKIIIQCANRKYEDNEGFRTDSGKKIVFVANPMTFEKVNDNEYQKPDDFVPSGKLTWREYLVDYNIKGGNPFHLHKAGDLYQPRIYKDLVDNFGWENVYILSAGWGLVRSDFLLPDYNITFSKQGKPGTLRKESDRFNDFNQFPNEIDTTEEVHFFGGGSYLPFLYTLLSKVPADKKIHYVQTNITKMTGYRYIKFDQNFTNWHYKCAAIFIRDHMN